MIEVQSADEMEVVLTMRPDDFRALYVIGGYDISIPQVLRDHDSESEEQIEQVEVALDNLRKIGDDLIERGLSF